MAFLGRLLGLTVLSVGSWIIPMTLLICGGTFNALIPLSQGLLRFCVLLIILLFPPVVFLLLVYTALRKNPFSISSQPIGMAPQVSYSKENSDDKRGELVDYERGSRGEGFGFPR